MNKPIVAVIVVGLFIGQPMFADIPDTENTVRLYQVGTKGRYCVSLSKDSGGCVSGVDDEGNPINVLDVALQQNKNARFVVFENLSDAPHDMRFSGANAEDLPAQEPNGEAAQKAIKIEDLSTQKINCSFHGDMLAVGYRVPKLASETIEEGHRERPAGSEGSATKEISPARPITGTGLSDVGSEVMKKGRPAEVEKLISNRPELMKDLIESRPLLAQDVLSKSPALNRAIQAAAATNKNEKAKDDFFGKKGPLAGGANPNVLGRPIQNPLRTAAGMKSSGDAFVGAKMINPFGDRGIASVGDDDDAYEVDEEEGSAGQKGYRMDENAAISGSSTIVVNENGEVFDKMRVKSARRPSSLAGGLMSGGFLWVIAAVMAGGGFGIFLSRKRRGKENV